MIPIAQGHRTLGKQLIDDITNKRISMDEFEKEVAYLAVDCGFNELAFMPYPSQPVELREYYQLSDKEKSHVTNSFWQQEFFAEYDKEYHKALAHNDGCLWWLRELLKRFAKYKDTTRINMVKDMIKTYPSDCWAGEDKPLDVKWKEKLA